MKTFFLAAVALSVLSVAVAQVSPDDHAAHHPDQASAPKTPAADGAVASADSMQARMREMAALMAQLDQTKDPAKRAKLLSQHRQMMHEQLDSMMRMGCAMKGVAHHGMSDKGPDGKGGPGMMSGGGMMNGDMMKCHDLMQARMDMMVGMMDQMLRREEARGVK